MKYVKWIEGGTYGSQAAKEAVQHPEREQLAGGERREHGWKAQTHINKFNFHLIKLIFIMYNTDYWVPFIAQKMIKRLFTGVKFFICK